MTTRRTLLRIKFILLTMLTLNIAIVKMSKRKQCDQAQCFTAALPIKYPGYQRSSRSPAERSVNSEVVLVDQRPLWLRLLSSLLSALIQSRCRFYLQSPNLTLGISLKG